MVAIARKLQSTRLPAHMILQIHDELVFEVAREAVAELADLVEAEMVGALALNGVPLVVDVAAGPNWLDLEPIGTR